ncbi:hypothetical protein BKI51_02695 [Alphaproteobacteria bacterium AO1-B]|nr:hypothetical protein BKI51_02695 [Alphaproteobacteria bacterium AO1-B]
MLDFHKLHTEMIVMVIHIGNTIDYEKGYEQWRGTNSRTPRLKAYLNRVSLVTATVCICGFKSLVAALGSLYGIVLEVAEKLA